MPWRQRLLTTGLSLSIVGAIVLGARESAGELRWWLPHAYLVLGYWLPAFLVPTVDRATRFEQWLLATDRALRRRLPSLPAPLAHAAELPYLFCYPLVPVSFLIVWVSGSTSDMTRFWSSVLGAGFLCYVSLPWLVSRPPRLLEDAPVSGALARVNLLVLGRVSHRLNTFPSGHVAVSVAAALALWTVAPIASIIVGVFAGSVAVGAASGRYHYVVDVLLGGVAAAIAAGAAAL